MGASILILQGDPEASLLADAQATLDACFPASGVRVHQAWTTRSDLLGQPVSPKYGLDPRSQKSAAELVGESHDVTILSTLPDVALPLLSGGDGAFVAHKTLAEQWTLDERTKIAESYQDGGLIELEEAEAAFERVIQDLQGRGQAVVLCNVFRHVAEPPQDRANASSLRSRIRAMNRLVPRLSHRTGCFVMDLDRVLAHEGGAKLGADCFGGGARAKELALEELVAVLLDALPALSSAEVA
jgi:hypothetical protein